MITTSGLEATAESEHRGNTRIDIEVFTKHLRVAVECEKYGPNKRREAVKDAASRLVPIQRVDVALAVVYPQGCDYEDDLTLESTLAFAVIHRSDAARYATDTARHTKSVRWLQCTAGELGTRIENLYRDIGEPEQIANDLKQRLDEAVGQLTVQQRRSLAKTIHYSGEKINEAAKRALLVVASASLFHARLGDHLPSMSPPTKHRGKWPPKALIECGRDRNALLGAWETILDLDYTPIFETAARILTRSGGVQFASAIYSMTEWALDATDKVEGLRHDLLGLIFHAVLDTARHDGSFYTTTPAAVLLAGVAIQDRNNLAADIKSMKVMDPACGTGTLLMAAAERMRDILGDEYNPNVLVEDVLCGVDINVTAAHMAATTVGLLSPDTRFDRMDIRVADLGIKDGSARAGSLEMYAAEGMLPYIDWYGGTGRQVETGQVARHSWANIADLIIMNPPFTRNDIRHDQFGRDVEMKIKKREEQIFSKWKGLQYSSGAMFIILAEHLQKKEERSTLAMVLPMVVATSPSNHQLRSVLAEKYHIDTIIAPHDPKRFYFSASTNIAEILIVLRREPPRNTKIVNLAINPETVAEATSLARAINEGDPPNARVIEWPRERVQKGDWSAVLFYSPYLVEQSLRIRDGVLFKVARLGEIARMGEQPRGVRMNFDASNSPDKYARFARYDHKTDEVRSLRAKPNKYLIAKPSREEQAENSWKRGGLLHVPERVQPNITHVLAVRTDHPSIGTSWYAVIPTDEDSKIWSKAMTVYLNSTVGAVAMLGARIPRKPLYPRYSVDDIQSIPLPVVSKRRMAVLASTYDRYKDADLGILRNPNSTREALDAAICRTLDLDSDAVNTMRRELSREPMITGKRYGEQAGMDDFR